MRNLDKENEEFWDEICGTYLAKSLDIGDYSLESLRKFDEAYFRAYPYLLERVRLEEMAEKRVLEIGIGFGTLGQKIARIRSDYTAVDLADKPLQLMRHRLRMQSPSGRAVKASALELPFGPGVFDCVISIGCFHHTGNVQRCIDETYRVLKPGGMAFIMVYNQYSYRQWIRWPIRNFLVFLCEKGLYKREFEVSREQKLAYDRDILGRPAPEVAFLSIGQLKNMFKMYSTVKFNKERCADIFIKGKNIFPIQKNLSFFPKMLGLDIYIEATK